MEPVNVAQIACANLVIEKNGRSFHLILPFGTPWEEAEEIADHFKAAVIEMKRVALEQQAAAQSAQNEAPINAEVVTKNEEPQDLQAFSAD